MTNDHEENIYKQSFPKQDSPMCGRAQLHLKVGRVFAFSECVLTLIFVLLLTDDRFSTPRDRV